MVRGDGYTTLVISREGAVRAADRWTMYNV